MYFFILNLICLFFNNTALDKVGSIYNHENVINGNKTVVTYHSVHCIILDVNLMERREIKADPKVIWNV